MDMMGVIARRMGVCMVQAQTTWAWTARVWEAWAHTVQPQEVQAQETQVQKKQRGPAGVTLGVAFRWPTSSHILRSSILAWAILALAILAMASWRPSSVV